MSHSFTCYLSTFRMLSFATYPHFGFLHLLPFHISDALTCYECRKESTDALCNAEGTETCRSNRICSSTWAWNKQQTNVTVKKGCSRSCDGSPGQITCDPQCTECQRCCDDQDLCNTDSVEVLNHLGMCVHVSAFPKAIFSCIAAAVCCLAEICCSDRRHLYMYNVVACTI